MINIFDDSDLNITDNELILSNVKTKVINITNVNNNVLYCKNNFLSNELITAEKILLKKIIKDK